MRADRHFFKVDSVSRVGKIIADKITKQTAKGPVLWLVSGGSATDVALAAAKLLEGSDTSMLTVSLADERYGPAGHDNSSWRQLKERGFRVPGAHLKPYLNDKSFEATLADVNDFFVSESKAGTYIIALLGMGADGHTAGILPGSPAVTSNNDVSGYRAADYDRITLSLKGIKELDEAVLYAWGPSKAAQLDKLAKQEIDPADQPAQIIKTLPRWAVYNDRIGEAI